MDLFFWLALVGFGAAIGALYAILKLWDSPQCPRCETGRCFPFGRALQCDICGHIWGGKML